MIKKLSFSIVAIVCAALLFYGLGAFASSSDASGSSATISGTVASVSEEKAIVKLTTDQGEHTVAIAKSVWVYRNDQKAQLSDLQAGDRAEIVLNSKKQAAYIKSYSQQAESSSVSPTAAPTPSQSATPSPSPSTKPAPTVSAGTPSPHAASSTSSANPGLEGLEVMINGKQFKLELKQIPGKGETKYEFNVKPDNGGGVHLKGDEAAEWIARLLGSVDLKSADARQELVAVIAQHYGLNPGELNVSVKGSLQNAVRGNDDDDKDDDHGRGNVNSSKHDDQSKNGKREKD